MGSRAMPQLDGVEHHFVDVDGLRMHYAEAGPTGGDPVVLLHGWPQHWYLWRRVMPLLWDRFRVIAPDLRGFGWTDAPRSSYSKEELGRDVAGLLQVLDLRDVRLAGHDWGGVASFHTALDVPERLRSLTAVATAHPWARGRPTATGVLAALAYQPVVGMPFLGPAVQRFTPLVEGLFLASGGDRIWSREERATFADQFREPDRAEAASRVYRTFLTREMRQKPPKQSLAVPARLILGTGDPIATARLNAGAAEQGIEIEIVDGSHWLPETRPDLIAERIAG